MDDEIEDKVNENGAQKGETDDIEDESVEEKMERMIVLLKNKGRKTMPNVRFKTS